MDRDQETISLVRAYNKYQIDNNASDFIPHVCRYFDAFKLDTITPPQLKLLLEIANKAGIPQFVDQLRSKYNKEPEPNYYNMSTIAAVLHDKSLMTQSGKKLHRYQKEVVDSYKHTKRNRFVLSAPTSFGKTFVVYEIIQKMAYRNIVLLFPTISLLTENYDLLISDKSSISNLGYEIHTLSNEPPNQNTRNIWVFTPERFLSFIDKHPNQKFDFAFIDEVYKIDSDLVIDQESEKENERNISYRVALEYACRCSNDILLAGPYMKFFDNSMKVNTTSGITSFNAFMEFNDFTLLDYNKYEIVKKHTEIIRAKKQYTVNGQAIEIGQVSKYEKTLKVTEAITEQGSNTILYVSTKDQAERYGRDFATNTNRGFLFSEERMDRLLVSFVEHLSSIYGDDWVVVKGLKMGIGIHHGLVPKYVQKEIIRLFNRGVINVLIATTTITEGVNTTAKNVVALSDKKGTASLTGFDAKNIAGRAGRFTQHYIGNIYVIDNNFEQIQNDTPDILKHKNYDERSEKSDVDYLITHKEYLNGSELVRIEELRIKQKTRDIPDSVMSLFKTIGPEDKMTVYDAILRLSSQEQKSVRELVRSLNNPQKMQIHWDGFQVVIDTLDPIIGNSKLKSLITYKCADSQQYSVLTAKLHYYLNGGFFDLLEYTLQQMDGKPNKKDLSIRKTADLVYNTFKYQLVKYLGIFDLMYRFHRSKTEGKDIDDISGIAPLLKKLEYNAINKDAQILSDFGVPFKIIEHYENPSMGLSGTFDTYESYINSRIQHLLSDNT